MIGTPRLLEILQLSSEKGSAVEVILQDFFELEQTDREASLTTTAESLFLLVFGDDATICSNPHFAERNSTVWSLNCRLSPVIFVSPRTSQDVAKSLALCQILEIKFSIRGGGHLMNPGFTSNNGGVVISMTNFNSVSVSEDQKTVEVGAGLTWSKVYQELDPLNLAVTGGRIPSVGVSGLLLGGGLSFHRGTKGLSCNGVVEYEVVLADSTIVKASATQKKDLFWALKGGGPNFGIVTKFTMSSISSTFWSEVRVFHPAENDNLLEALARFSENVERDPEGSLLFHSAPEATLLILFHTGEQQNRLAVFDSFEGISPLSHMIKPKEYSFSQIMTGLEGSVTMDPTNHDMRVMSSLPDLEVYKAANRCRYVQFEALKHIHGINIILDIQPISLNTVRVTNAGIGSPLGIVEKPQQWLLVMSEWSNQEDEGTVREATRKIINEAEAVARRNGTFLEFKYSNYASRDQDPLSTYGKENLDRLRNIARSYDPKGVFQTLQNGGWLLDRVGKSH